MQRMNITISIEKLASLIRTGHLCAADIQCLDKQTKQQLWQLCLWCCDKRAFCRQVACQTLQCQGQSTHSSTMTEAEEVIFTQKEGEFERWI